MAFSTDCARPPCTTGYHPQARQRVSGSAAVQAASRPPDGGGVALRAGLVRGERRQALRCGAIGTQHRPPLGIQGGPHQWVHLRIAIVVRVVCI